MTVSRVFSNCISQHLANLPYRSEVCARSELCSAGRVQMCRSLYACFSFFVSALSNHEATATFDLWLAVIFSLVCFCKL